MLNWLKKIRQSRNILGSNKQTNLHKDLRSADPVLQEKCIALRKKGNELLSKGQLAEAEKVYRQAVDINPNYAECLVNLGFILRSLDKTAEAEQYLLQAVALNSKLEDAYFILGEILQSRDDFAGAIEHYRKALQLKPEFEHVYNNLYHALVQNNQEQDAQAVLDQAITLYPNSIEINFLRGHAFAKEEDMESAIASFNKALSIDPNYIPALIHLGNAFKDQGKLDTALESYQKALELNPENPDVFNNIGALFQERDDLVQAAINYRKAIAQKPDYSEAYNNLAGVLIAQAKPDEAIAAFQQALSINPDSAEVRNNYGKILRQQGRLVEAEIEIRKAIELKPDYFDAYNGLGTILRDQGRREEAIECFQQAVNCKPDFVMGHNNIAAMFQEQGNHEKALDNYKQSLIWNPDLTETKVNLLYMALFLHEWKDLQRLSNEIKQTIIGEDRQKKGSIAPFSFLAIPGTTVSEQQACSIEYAQRISRAMRPWREKINYEFIRDAKSKKKIRIGYFSADYRYHPVAHLMAQIFTLHDRERFQVFAYSTGPDDGTDMRARLRASFDDFIDIQNMSDVDAAKRIYEDEVDILINLTGYTQHSRAEIIALRPAPIQVNYLGYPGTMGADFIDYLIADQFIIPPEYRKYYAEEVLWLPEAYMPRDSTLRRLPAPSRKDCGLPEDGFIFCSFNQPYKITPDVFDLWCLLLKAVPGSVLWLPTFKPEAEENMSREARNRGVSADRIIRAPRADLMEEHLARLQCADLFLDTTPYNAHTTCSDALWMGLPVITCAGETFPSRVAGSLLAAIGAPELITYNLENYYDLALSLATDKEKYQQVRSKIIAKSDSVPLFDTTKFTRDLEHLYQEIWGKYLGRDNV